MAKDPILPIYYNDLDRSTRDWTDEEFGAYLRLLMHQWDKGSLPKDYQRLTRIATSLDTTWPLIKGKFVEKDGGLINQTMEDIRVKRAKHKRKQRENVLNRYQNSTNNTTKNLPLENEYEIENEKEIKEGGMGEGKFIVPEMQKVFVKHNPTYPASKEHDFHALQSISKFLAEHSKGDILNEWQKISIHIAGSFYRDKSLKTVNSHITSIYQEYKNPKANGTKQRHNNDSGSIIPIRKTAGRL